MQAYLNDPILKIKMIAEMEEHRLHDQIRSGLYSTFLDGIFHGCAIGCALHSLQNLGLYNVESTPEDYEDHAKLEILLGIPTPLAHLIDSIFENLPSGLQQTWPGRVLEAIPVGADLRSVVPGVVTWSILDPTFGLAGAVNLPEHLGTLREFAAAVGDAWGGIDTLNLPVWDARLATIPEIQAQRVIRAWRYVYALLPMPPLREQQDWRIASDETLRLIRACK